MLACAWTCQDFSFLLLFEQKQPTHRMILKRSGTLNPGSCFCSFQQESLSNNHGLNYSQIIQIAVNNCKTNNRLYRRSFTTWNILWNNSFDMFELQIPLVKRRVNIQSMGFKYNVMTPKQGGRPCFCAVLHSSSSFNIYVLLVKKTVERSKWLKSHH